MTFDKPEALAKAVMTTCVNCDQCRELMEDAPCQYFPRLFNLADRAKAGGAPVSARDLADLVDLCNACGQCPCRPVQIDIRRAKDAFVERDGLPTVVRFIENVELVGKACGTFPALTNLILDAPALGRLARRIVGVHPERKMPKFPRDRLARWISRRGLDRPRPAAGRKVAYFVGCTARYLFPDVAKATVDVLERNGISVYVPEQKCCGMPSFLEGDQPFTSRLADTNLPVLRQCIDDGYDIVSACPTCSFMFKSILTRDAQFSPAFRDRIRALGKALGDDTNAIRDQLVAELNAPTGRSSSAAVSFTQAWVINYNLGLHAESDKGDVGYFSSRDANQRIKVATHVFELGEYLRDLDKDGALNMPATAPVDRLTYFPPCHLREQAMGKPWLELLGRLPKADVAPVGRPLDCCGLGGIMGFKTNFHAASLAMGRGLIDRIADAAPDRIVTECLACRLQFTQMQAKPVVHPVELLADAYRAEAAPGKANDRNSGLRQRLSP